MRNSVTVVVAILSILALGTAVLAAPPRSMPHRYAPNSLDGRLVQVERPDGAPALAAWAYRNGAEYDIAIASADARGRWSEPVFIGLDDGRDQVQPALAVDGNGNVYLAYADTAEGRVLLTVLRSDWDEWSRPIALTGLGSGADSPVLRVVSDRLAVAFRMGDELQLIDLPLTDTTGRISLLTIVDHPDPVEYNPDPGMDDPSDQWKDGRWVIGDDNHPIDIYFPRRSSGGSGSSGSDR